MIFLKICCTMISFQGTTMDENQFTSVFCSMLDSWYWCHKSAENSAEMSAENSSADLSIISLPAIAIFSPVMKDLSSLKEDLMMQLLGFSARVPVPRKRFFLHLLLYLSDKRDQRPINKSIENVTFTTFCSWSLSFSILLKKSLKSHS